MDDITCSHCGEPWEVYGLRHDEELGTYQRVLCGLGCPSCDPPKEGKAFCGYEHEEEGQFRLKQLEQLADGVTDDDPSEFV